MARDIKRKAGQYCPNCRKAVMAVNDNSFMSGGGWFCPDCGQKTFGAIGQMLIRKAEQRAAAQPKYTVTCPYCATALVAPAGPSVKCPKCGQRLSVTPSPTPSPPPSDAESMWIAPRNAIGPPTALDHGPTTVDEPVTSDPVTRIEHLREMRDAGDLTEDEFEILKSRVMSNVES